MKERLLYELEETLKLHSENPRTRNDQKITVDIRLSIAELKTLIKEIKPDKN